VALLDEGNTVSFIARYRRDQTGGLDEEAVRRVQQRAALQRVLADRKNTVIRSIEAQGKLTEELRAAVDAAEGLKRIEDLYLPFKPKKQTPATIARERGLGPLADAVWQDAESARDLAAVATTLVDPAKLLNTADEVIAGVGHIVAETISENAATRTTLRRIIWLSGKLICSKADGLNEEKAKAFREYFEFKEPLEKIAPHRVLVIHRGEEERALETRIEIDDEAARQTVLSLLPPDGHTHLERLRAWTGDALTLVLRPALEREVHRQLHDEAEEHAARAAARSLRCLLLQPPVCGKRVLAIDPGFRTGCKLAMLDERGGLVAHALINPHPPVGQRAEAKQAIVELVRQHGVHVVAIGNGAGCRETEEFVAEIIAESLPELSFTIVNETGTGHYSTSAIGREEFPDLDATIRVAVSLGRRLQDPLAEFVKIEPQHLAAGLNQHEVHPRHLKESLGAVVEACVNMVGADLSAAGVPLLRYMAGLNQLTARRIVEWRQKNGPFARREQLKEVEGVTDAVFTQAAGFLRIAGGSNPLDATWVHPENYPLAEKLLAKFGATPDVLRNRDELAKIEGQLKAADFGPLTTELELSDGSLSDLIDDLARPARDPREDETPPLFRTTVVKLADLKPGMELRGAVLNVVDFGAFVDIGLKESGLVHISQLSTRFIRSPYDAVTIGQVVSVWVMAIDGERSRVSLTMIAPGTQRRPPQRPQRARRDAPRAATTAPPAAEASADTDATVSAPRPAAPPPRPQRRPAPPPRPPERRPRPQPAPPPLPQAVLEGAEPARSFGELKRLWDAKKKS